METKDFNALHGDEIDEQHGFIIDLDPDDVFSDDECDFIGNRYFREL
jgi:hypothetical protein